MTDQKTATRPTDTDAWDNVAAHSPASPIPAALDTARDGLHRSDALLEELAQALGRLITAVEPVLTNGSPAPYPNGDDVNATPSAEDRRSTIARAIAELENHARRQGDELARIIRRVGAVIESVEA